MSTRELLLCHVRCRLFFDGEVLACIINFFSWDCPNLPYTVWQKKNNITDYRVGVNFHEGYWWCEKVPLTKIILDTLGYQFIDNSINNNIWFRFSINILEVRHVYQNITQIHTYKQVHWWWLCCWHNYRLSYIILIIIIMILYVVVLDDYYILPL